MRTATSSRLLHQPDCRPDGWEARFAAVLRDASRREFHARDWNCAEFARQCAEAITCRPIPRRLSRTLKRTVDAYFPRIGVRQASRGDVVLANLPNPTLGVCAGSVAAFVSPAGLTEIPMSQVLIAWRVD